MRNSNPWLTFDDDRKKFIERENRAEQTSEKELENSHELAILQRLTLEERVIIVAFGYGEVGTAAVVRHLARIWKDLTRKKHKEFAQLLLVDSLGEVQVLKQYP